MFYNLKIYSNNSEFSLNSQDKLIIEREMDLYFSFFFDASGDFKTKIKKLDFKKESSGLKSIDDFENSVNNVTDSLAQQEKPEAVDTDSQVKFSQIPQEEKIDNKNDIKMSEDEIKNLNNNINSFVDSKDKIFEETDDEIKIVNKPKSEFTLEDINSPVDDIEIKTEVNKPKAMETLSLKSEVQSDSEVGDILSKAVDELNSLDIKKENGSIENLVNLGLTGDINYEKPKEQKTKDDSWLDELDFGGKNNDDIDIVDVRIDSGKENILNGTDEEKSSSNKKENTSESSVEVLYERDENEKSHQSALEDIFDFKNTEFSQSKNDDVNSGTSSSDVELAPEQNANNEKMYHIQEENLYTITTSKYDDTSANETKIDLNEPAETKTQSDTKKNILNENSGVHDFGDFLNNFNHSKIADEFLICAYYVKNFTDSESFTMKNINAKIFRATGKIAGMSILSELVEKKLIALVEDLDIKKYSITPEGEEYFLNNFQK